jgi:hypothetical protein
LIPTVSQVRPGLLVSHRYTAEFALVLEANYDRVRVLTTACATVTWGFDAFRFTYEVVQNSPNRD